MSAPLKARLVYMTDAISDRLDIHAAALGVSRQQAIAELLDKQLADRDALVHFKVRLPVDLKRDLDAAADAADRSTTAEIVRRLRESFANGGAP